MDFGSYINAIYPSELELKDTSTLSAEVCFLDTNIKTADIDTLFRISIYDKGDDFAFRIVNFNFLIWTATFQLTAFMYLRKKERRKKKEIFFYLHCLHIIYIAFVEVGRLKNKKLTKLKCAR